MYLLLCIDHLGNEHLEEVEAFSLPEAFKVAKELLGYDKVKQAIKE